MALLLKQILFNFPINNLSANIPIREIIASISALIEQRFFVLRNRLISESQFDLLKRN